MRLQPLAVSASAEKSLDLQLQLRVVVASKAEKHRLQKLLRLPLLLLVFSAGMAEQRLRLELSCVSWVPAWRANALEMNSKTATDDDPMVGYMHTQTHT